MNASNRRPGARICLVTTGHLATNPRLVKEADALAAAGYHVRVVACKFTHWAGAPDAEFADRPWKVDWVRFGEMASPMRRHALRARKALCSMVVRALGVRPLPALRALHYVVPELTSMACRDRADMFVAHNLAALPAATRAAQEHRARLGFDAEDFHRGEFATGESEMLSARLTRWAEERFIPHCDYVTAASDGIGEAYAEVLGIEKPVTILNAFPRPSGAVLDEPARFAEKPAGAFSLYWFGQTMGPGRGLEDAVAALPALGQAVVLSVRGNVRVDFRLALEARARSLGVGDRLRWLSPAPPGEMVDRAACHDVGLALEPGNTPNNDLAVSNKLFTYLQAGLPVVATATSGQRRIAESIPGAAALVPPGDTASLARAITEVHRTNGEARAAAREAARRFSWHAEREKLLAVVERVLGGRAS